MDQDIKVKSKSLKLLEGHIGEYFYEGFKKTCTKFNPEKKRLINLSASKSQTLLMGTEFQLEKIQKLWRSMMVMTHNNAPEQSSSTR